MWGGISFWFWPCISIMVSDVEQLCICFLPFVYLWRIVYLISPLSIFELGCLVFWWVVSSLCLLHINPLSDICFANMFFYSLGCLFHSLDIVLWCPKAVNFDEISFFKKNLLLPVLLVSSVFYLKDICV